VFFSSCRVYCLDYCIIISISLIIWLLVTLAPHISLSLVWVISRIYNMDYGPKVNSIDPITIRPNFSTHIIQMRNLAGKAGRGRHVSKATPLAELTTVQIQSSSTVPRRRGVNHPLPPRWHGVGGVNHPLPPWWHDGEGGNLHDQRLHTTIKTTTVRRRNSINRGINLSVKQEKICKLRQYTLFVLPILLLVPSYLFSLKII
jgi:hypothetical protein